MEEINIGLLLGDFTTFVTFPVLGHPVASIGTELVCSKCSQEVACLATHWQVPPNQSRFAKLSARDVLGKLESSKDQKGHWVFRSSEIKILYCQTQCQNEETNKLPLDYSVQLPHALHHGSPISKLNLRRVLVCSVLNMLDKDFTASN